jgi:hypothetical protein
MNKQEKNTLLATLRKKHELAVNQLASVILVRRKRGPAKVYVEGTWEMAQLIRDKAGKLKLTLTDREVSEIESQLVAEARNRKCKEYVTNLRVAPRGSGIQIDRGDPAHTRFDIQPGKVSIIQGGDDPLFLRTPGMAEFAMPAEEGDITLLERYLNLPAPQQQLLIAHLSYTLALPRSKAANYVHLIVLGAQGDGKSFLCNHVICSLVDPCHWGLQVFPFNKQDLVITLQNAHLSVFDNMRDLSKHWSDILCIAATGGSLSTRQLYTNREELRSKLHGPLVLNGISPFVSEPDLAQRCLTLELIPISEKARKTEAELAAEFYSDLPVILRGLLDLIAAILLKMPDARVTSPQRMLEFTQWIAAYELATGIPQGDLQGMYADNLRESQHHSIMDNALGAAILELIESESSGSWHGTPTKLLHALTAPADFYVTRAEWPRNAVALSKRLKALSPALQSQGIQVEFNRGKERTITITRRG